MAGIEDLKNKNAGGGNDPLVIDATGGAQRRQVVNLSSIAPPKKKDENIRESLQNDILVGENSPFAQYKREKEEEYRSRMAEMEAQGEVEDDGLMIDMTANNDPDEGEFGVENDAAPDFIPADFSEENIEENLLELRLSDEILKQKMKA